MGEIVPVQQPPAATPEERPFDPVRARDSTFTPRSGPTGTLVTVETHSLPAVTPVYLGMGATRSSFEVLTQLLTDEMGTMTATIPVPDWATSDRTHFFVVVDVYFRPLAVSDGFHVTETDGALARRGVIARDGRCLILREAGESKEQYTLTGDGLQELTVGQEVWVEGELTDATDCGTAASIRVMGVR